MIVTVERSADLVREEWRFTVVVTHKGVAIVLDEYAYAEQETKRHKHKVLRRYNRLSTRNSNVEKSAVPMPSSVTYEALEKVQGSIVVTLDYPR